MFGAFQDWLEDPEAESGFVNSGYIIVAGEGDFADKMRANLAMQAEVGAETREISRQGALDRHPLLNLEDAALVGYEPRSGYADPYLTTASFLKAARAKGAVIKTGCDVQEVLMEGGRVTGVATGQGMLSAPLVVSALGPWTPRVTDALGIEIPLEVSRHIVLTFTSGEPVSLNSPLVKVWSSTPNRSISPDTLMPAMITPIEPVTAVGWATTSSEAIAA